MNIFKRWFGKNELEVKSTPTLTANQLGAMLNTGVDPLKVEAVWSCIRDKAETTGMIPLKLYKQGEKGRELVRKGRTHRIFTQAPCDYMTMQEFLEFGTFWLERKGAFYAYKVKNDRGNVSQIIPFRFQDNVVANYDVQGNVYYTYTTNDGQGVGTNYRLEDLFIVRGMSFDGITPISPLAYQANLLGIAVAQQENYKELQTNGITSQMALSTDAIFNDANARTRLQEDWGNYRGSNGYSAVPIFENGIKPVSLKLTPQESELLGHQQFTVDRVCRLFRVPLHRVGAAKDNDGDTSNIFDLDEAYLRNSIMPNLCKFQAQFNKIVGEEHSVEFNTKAYYAGSPWRIGEAVDKVVKGGLVSINEGRGDLGYDPVEGGDVFAVDNNNVVYATWDKREEAQQMIYNQTNQNQVTPSQEESNNGE